MDNYKAFYEFVKSVIESKEATDHAEDKVKKITSAIELMEIITKE
jgi:hypothetical protein